MSKPVVLVTGATGNCGFATVKYLQGKDVVIRAGVHDEKKAAEKLKGLTADIVAIDGEKDMSSAFKGVDAVLIVPPQAKRGEVTTGYINAAKAAGVKFIALISITLANDSETVFGKQFGPLEKAIQESKIPYSFIRGNFFMENFYGNVGGIKATNAFYYPADANVKYTPITTDDIGAMAAAVLINPQKYANSTLYASGDDVVTLTDVAAIYSKVLKREIKFVQVSNADCKKALMGMNFPEWQVDGIIELWARVSTGQTMMSNPGDFAKIVGRKATTVEAFLTTIAAIHN